MLIKNIIAVFEINISTDEGSWDKCSSIDSHVNN